MATEKRLIDANDVPELLEKEFVRKWRLVLDGETHLDNLAEGFFSAKSVIWAMPTVDAVEVVHGRWVLAKPRVKGRNATYRCTACGKLRSSYYNDVFQWEYCPCGAKMDGDWNG